MCPHYRYAMSPEMEIEKEAEKLKISQQHPEILEEPQLLESVLLPLETFFLRRMLIKNTPQNTQSLYNAAVINLFTKWYEREYPRRLDKPHLAEKLRSIEKLTLITADQFGKVHALHWIHSPSAKEINTMTEVLREENASPPSIYKIERTMETLQGWGFVTKRYDEAGNTKFYWVLQPAFTKKYGKKVKEYLSKREVALEW